MLTRVPHTGVRHGNWGKFCDPPLSTGRGDLSTVLSYTNVSRGVDSLHISPHTNYGGVPSYHFHLPITRQYYCRDCGRLTLTQQTGTRRQHPLPPHQRGGLRITKRKELETGTLNLCVESWADPQAAQTWPAERAHQRTEALHSTSNAGLWGAQSWAGQRCDPTGLCNAAHRGVPEHALWPQLVECLPKAAWNGNWDLIN